MDFLPHSITIFNPYLDKGETKYKRHFIKHCKFNPTQAVQLGSVQVTSSDQGKVFVYEKDLDMSKYVTPNEFKGEGFTLSKTSYVVIGEYDKEIESVKDLKGLEHYTIESVDHNNYSFVLPHHFVLGVK
ncbi:DUF3379 domain-containing protein [Erysipelothrix sp. HDW6C]|uniref:DUF3379 domain-containing protein n=1 Tax=Erysipelothrix sp. HDW6C TaxID=2714930 RepID=UPI001407E530|nr:DUF3379 domain-containing protein [Erysipelothrix sp. HDW6C]QIK70841.1 DUF3379 domain-containing protein [Erysipelothrix sp. HDW6C]